MTVAALEIVAKAPAVLWQCANWAKQQQQQEEEEQQEIALEEKTKKQE